MTTLTEALAKNRDFGKTVSPVMLVAVDDNGIARPVTVDALGNFVVATTTLALNILHSLLRNYSTDNVTTSAWIELIASTSAITKKIKIDDTSGQVLEIGTGTAGNEVHLCYIPQGGIDAEIDLTIPAGTRVCVKAVSATANTGYLVMEVIG